MVRRVSCAKYPTVGQRKRGRGTTYTTHVDHDMKPMARPLYHSGQFLGLAASFSSSQSTSKFGSMVPVVPMDVALRERVGRLVTRETCGVSAFSGSSNWSWMEMVVIESTDLDEAVECIVWGEALSAGLKDMFSGVVKRIMTDTPRLFKLHKWSHGLKVTIQEGTCRCYWHKESLARHGDPR